MTQSNFVDALQHGANLTQTTNGATAFNSSLSSVVDLYFKIGQMRTYSTEAVEREFVKSFSEDKDLTLKMLYHARDVREGMGERKTFRTILRLLGRNYPEQILANIQWIPEFGRWDDMFELIGSDIHKSVKDKALYMIMSQIELDFKSETPSLLAKWLPSESTSNKEKKQQFSTIRKYLGLSSKEYRKYIGSIRAKLNLVETKMSKNQWTIIEYPKVPSQCMRKHGRAFKRHDLERFELFTKKVVKGEEKINVGTVYPYELLEDACGGRFDLGSYNRINDLVEAQWKSLPNYLGDSETNVLFMGDSSGSMSGRPMATSIGLGIYFAERNTGVWHNKFLTFSESPNFVELKGDSLYAKIKCIPSIVANTNLEKAFNLILSTAVNNNIRPEDMPKSLIVCSDMQFDQCTGRQDKTLYENFNSKFIQYGYQMPNVIFWNVGNSETSTFQAKSQYANVQMASGQSPKIFEAILKNIGKTPLQAVIDTLSTERYSVIKAV